MAHKIMVNCGHGKLNAGGWDAGCVYGKYTEAGLMLPITKAAVKYLRASGVTVLSDADQNNNRNMVSDVSWANREGVELYVSIHCDYSGAPSGVMPLYVSDRGKKIAVALNNAIKAEIGIRSRGVIRRSDLYELNATNMAACILETGAIKRDLPLLRDRADQYGKAIAKGLCKHLGVTFNGAKEPAKEPKELYRVRKDWKDPGSQVGAFSDLEHAKRKADETGLTVFNSKGANVYSAVKTEQVYRVRRTWADVKSQVGAFRDLSKAKALCNKHEGYHVYDAAGKEIYTSAAKPKTAAEKFLAKLEAMEKEMRGWSYSNKGGDHADTWAGAKKKRKTNCATFVSWALQETGVLTGGDLLYCNKRAVHNQRGNAVAHLKAKATISYPGKAPKAAGLKPGDICGYTTHTQVFAGWDKSGNPLWYSMGGSDIGKDLPRVKSDYNSRKIEVLIRLK